MIIAKKLTVFIFAIYTIISYLLSIPLKIHWIHILDTLVLINILYHLLQWKYDWVEEEQSEE